MQEDAAYIPVEEVAALLGVTTRQAARYKDRVRTKRAGKRMLYHRDDVQALAALRGEEQVARDMARTHHGTQPSPRTTTAGLLGYLREREAHADQLQQQLHQALHRIGALEAQLALCIRPEEATALQLRIASVEAEVQRLRTLLERGNG